MKIQLNATSIKQVQDLTNRISGLNAEIRTCLVARDKRRIWEAADPASRSNELPLRAVVIQANHHAGHSSYHANESQAERDALFDITEILIRTRRDQLVAQLSNMGVVLTDLPNLGPAPAWPGQPSSQDVQS